MRLYPLPTCVRATRPHFTSMFPPFFSMLIVMWVVQVVLADKYDSYRMTYESCHVFNPGRFLGRSLGFSTYTPASRESEAWYVTYSIYLSSPIFSRSACYALGADNIIFFALHHQRRGIGGGELTMHADLVKVEEHFFDWNLLTLFVFVPVRDLNKSPPVQMHKDRENNKKIFKLYKKKEQE
jgi:hypothetical protein